MGKVNAWVSHENWMHSESKFVLSYNMYHKLISHLIVHVSDVQRMSKYDRMCHTYTYIKMTKESAILTFVEILVSGKMQRYVNTEIKSK